jgi:hypothetical protein
MCCSCACCALHSTSDAWNQAYDAFTKFDRARIAAEMSPTELFLELYRRKALAAARRSLAIVSALVG